MVLLLGVLSLAFALAGIAVFAANRLGLGAVVLRSYRGPAWSIEAEVEELASAATLAPSQIASRALRDIFVAALACHSDSEAAQLVHSRFETLVHRVRRRERRLSIARWTPAIACAALLLAFVGLAVGGIAPGRLAGMPGVGFLGMVLAAVACVPAAWAAASQPRGAARLVLRHAMVLEAVLAARNGEALGSVRARLQMLAFPDQAAEHSHVEVSRAQAA